MVADVMKSFDAVDRSILDCALGRLGLLTLQLFPVWLRVFLLVGLLVY